jgi:hypothetical protein
MALAGGLSLKLRWLDGDRCHGYARVDVGSVRATSPQYDGAASVVDNVLYVSLEEPFVRAGHAERRFEELGDNDRLFVRRLIGHHRPY